MNSNPDAFANDDTAGCEFQATGDDLDAQLGDDLRVVLDRRQSVRPATEAKHDTPLGWQLAQYEVHSVLGEGGMARVYRAQDTGTGRMVALKVLKRELRASPDIRSRFAQEAQSMLRVVHPNVVRVLGTPSDLGRTAIAMELLSGGGLRELIQIGVKRKRHMGTCALLRFAEQAARGIGAAHAAGIVHRDIKPSNLLLDAEGTVKIADFGIVLALERATWLTGLGRPIGTPAYMSPEQCKGTRVTSASDVYSFGVTMFELATRRLPFTEQAESPFALMLKHIREQPPDLRDFRANLPGWFVRIVHRCLEKNPERRFADGAELAGAVAAGPTTQQSPRRETTDRPTRTLLNTVAIREQLKRLPQRAILAWACRCARRALVINDDPRLERSIETAEDTLRHNAATESGPLSSALRRIRQLRSASFSVVDSSASGTLEAGAACVAIAVAATCACAAARCVADAAADAAFVAEKSAAAYALTGRQVSKLWSAAQADYRALLSANLGAEGSIGLPIPADFWKAHGLT